MKQSQKPLWKKSMLVSLNFGNIIEFLNEIGENGDMYGYDRDEEGYYQEYKPLFDDLSDGAYRIWEALQESDVRENWDDMTVALLGHKIQVFGYNTVEEDYYRMLNHEEDWAVGEAAKRLERLTKSELLRCFKKVMTTLILFFDIKAAHDCLTSIVEELDERGAILAQKNTEINRLYQDLTGANEANFDRILSGLPQRMWIE